MTKPHGKPWSCQFLSESVHAEPRPAAAGRGYAFLILMMMVTILLISLTAALPSIYTEGQREKEEELIFRGREYARAILFFHNKFGRYPSRIDELIKKTNGIRFLRHAYKDPMTASGEWRYIHANAAGMVIDSKTMTTPINPGNQNGLKGLGQTGSQSTPSSTFGKSGSGSPSGEPSTSQSGQTTDQAGEDSNSSTFKSPVGQLLGGFIVGVASTSTRQSIRVLDNQTEYDKWEFLAVGQDVRNLLAPGGNNGNQNQSNQPDQPGAGSGKTPTKTPVTPPPTEPGSPEGPT